MWGNKDDRAKYNAPFWSTGWFRWRTWRSPAAGLDHLNWASNLTMNDDWGVSPEDENYGKPTQQAEAAKEILALYKWWTIDYRARRDPHDLSGWSDWCDRHRDEGILSILDDRSPGDAAESKRILEVCQKIDDERTAEDEAMMIRLIKIRNNLWT